MRVQCLCGATYTLPDTFAGDRVRCRACAGVIFLKEPDPASIPVARLAAGPKPFPVALVVGLVGVLIVAGVAGAYYLRRSKKYTPTQAESVEEKYLSASQSFAGPPAVIDPKSDEGKVVACLDALAEAQRTGQGAKFSSHLHMRRLLVEAQRGGVLPGFRTRKGEADYIRGLEKGMVDSITQNAHNQMLHWMSVRVFRVTFQPERGEAQVFCSVRLGGGVSAKFRFWLIKEGDSWRVFDWESMEEGIRVSVLLSSMIGATGNQPRRAQELEQLGGLLQQAMLKTNEGDLDGAKTAIARARGLSPPGGVVALLDVLDSHRLAAEGKFEEALGVLDSALSQNPDLPLAHHLKAGHYGALEKYEDCVREELEYLRMLGDDPEAYASLGSAYESLGKKAEAVEAYRKGIACDEKDVDNRYGLASLILEDGKVDEAAKLFLESCKNAADPGTYVEGAARLLYDADAPEAVLELCAGRPDGVAVLYYRGYALSRLGRHAEAEQTLRAGVALKDEAWASNFATELAYALGHLGKVDEALSWADRVVSGSGASARYVRAYVHAAAKQEDEAVREMTRALKISPYLHEEFAKEVVFERLRARSDVRALLDRGRIAAEYVARASELSDEGSYEELLRLSEEHVVRAPDDPNGWYFKGVSLRMLDRSEDAKAALLAGLELDDPDQHPLYWEELGYVHLDLGRHEEALGFATRLEEVAERRVGGHYLRAQVLVSQGRGDEAVEALRKLLELEPMWHYSVEQEPAFADLVKRPEVQEMLKKAKQD